MLSVVLCVFAVACLTLLIACIASPAIMFQRPLSPNLVFMLIVVGGISLPLIFSIWIIGSNSVDFAGPREFRSTLVEDASKQVLSRMLLVLQDRDTYDLLHVKQQFTAAKHNATLNSIRMIAMAQQNLARGKEILQQVASGINQDSSEPHRTHEMFENAILEMLEVVQVAGTFVFEADDLETAKLALIEAEEVLRNIDEKAFSLRIEFALATAYYVISRELEREEQREL